MRGQWTRKSCTHLVVRRSDGLVSRCETYLISHISCLNEKLIVTDPDAILWILIYIYIYILCYACSYFHVMISCAANDINTLESLQFGLATIEAATNNFSDDNKLGEGGFGAVYKVNYWFFYFFLFFFRAS